jgi:hypothetical protein
MCLVSTVEGGAKGDAQAQTDGNVVHRSAHDETEAEAQAHVIDSSGPVFLSHDWLLLTIEFVS